MKGLRIFVAAVLLSTAACASNKPKPDTEESGDVSHQPPGENEDEVAMPSGPPVVRSTDDEQGSGDVQPSEAPVEGEQVTVAKSDLEQFMDRGPSYLLTVVTVEPVHREGGFQGYQIVDVKRGAREFMTPQMRVGDVVTHVNGVRLKRPEDYMQAWRSLDKVSTIRVDFLRKSEPMNAVWVVK